LLFPRPFRNIPPPKTVNISFRGDLPPFFFFFSPPGDRDQDEDDFTIDVEAFRGVWRYCSGDGAYEERLFVGEIG
jgi:hypothetical protein